MTVTIKPIFVAGAALVVGIAIGSFVTENTNPAHAQTGFTECKSLAISTSGYPRSLSGWQPVGAANSGAVLYSIVCR